MNSLPLFLFSSLISYSRRFNGRVFARYRDDHLNFCCFIFFCFFYIFFFTFSRFVFWFSQFLFFLLLSCFFLLTLTHLKGSNSLILFWFYILYTLPLFLSRNHIVGLITHFFMLLNMMFKYFMSLLKHDAKKYLKSFYETLSAVMTFATCWCPTVRY